MKLHFSVPVSLALLTGVAYARPRFLQEPATDFVCKHDTPPDIIPFTPDPTPAPSTVPSVAPSPAPTTVDCIPNIEISGEDITPALNYPPITILAYEENEVLFTASQAWSDKTLCQVAVDYSAASQSGAMTCDPHSGVGPGEFGTYRAMCVDGFTTITVYAQDDVFKPTGNAVSVPSRCGSITPGPSTITHTIKIPCVMEPGCPSNEPPVCDGSEDMVVSPLESFEDGNVDGWTFGEPAIHQGNGVLGPVSETAKAFWVPKAADALVVTFKVLEMTCDSHMVIRVDDALIELGDSFDCEAEDTHKGYAGDIYVQSTPLSDTENEVTLTIPSGWYDTTGRITIGFVASTVGIDDFEITSICSGPIDWPVESQAPSMAPTADCIPDITFESGSKFEFEYPPIEIVKYEGKQVTFTASQTWSDNTLCQVAVDYSAASSGGSMVCDPHAGVPPGQVGTYTAMCVDGFTTITVYAQDDIFKPDGNALSSIPSRCGSITPGPSTITHTIKIPCVMEPGCPANEPPVCDGSEDMVVVDEQTFDDDVEGWMFAEHGEQGGNGFLGPVDEMAMTLAVPTAADALVVNFKVLELSCDSKLVLRVEDSLIELGAAFDCNEADSYRGYAGDIWVQSTALSNTENEMQLLIPSEWFANSGRITIGFVASTVGIDDFSMTSDCSGSVVWPGDCIPDITFDQGDEADFDYPPIEILAYEGTSVVFSASQAWTDKTLCQVAVDYNAANNGGAMTCDPHAGVAPGEFGVYRAVCVDGFAHIDVYAKDDFFTETTATVPSRCMPLTAGQHTHSYKISIPCNLEPLCPPLELPTCTGGASQMVTSEATFPVTTSETSKTYNVPKNASNLSISFNVIEKAAESSVHFRIDDHIIDLADLKATQGFFGDIQMTKSSNKVELKVPSAWYMDTGRLTVGFIDSNVGVSDFEIMAACAPVIVRTAGRVH